jgi:hypothetical protein
VIISRKDVGLPLPEASRFTSGTRRRIERALGRTVPAPSRTRDALRAAVRAVVAELLAAGVAPDDVEPILRRLVVQAGIAHGVYTPSVVTQSPRWRQVEERVVRWSRYDMATVLDPADTPSAHRTRRRVRW